MHYLKRNTKFAILAFLVIILSITISISTLAKTEVYFSLSDNPQKAIIKNINPTEAFINIAMYIFTDREIAIPLVKALPLLTGSYNWTFSANNRNNENLMVIDDPEVIEIFQNQFINLWTNKYSLERTRQLYQKAKVDFLPAPFAPAKPEDKLETSYKTIEAYKQTIRINPDDAIAHCNLGFAYDQLGFHEEAREAYIRAIRIDPDYAEAHYRLGLDYVIFGFRILAIEAYKQAVRIDPDYAEAHYSLGVAYLLIKDRDSAINEYKILKVLDIDLANKLFDSIY